MENTNHIQKIRLLSQADRHENLIDKASTIEEACQLVEEAYAKVNRTGRRLFEAIFWLGGSISKAHSLSQWGDKFFPEMERRLHISAHSLRRALNTWDFFYGDIVELYNWYNQLEQNAGKVLMRDLEDILKSNKELIEDRGHLRRVEGSLARDEVKEEIIKKTGLKQAIQRRKKQLREQQPKFYGSIRQAKVTLPPFRKLSTLIAAKRKLIFEPEMQIPIERVRLSDDQDYDLVVSLKKKDKAA